MSKKEIRIAIKTLFPDAKIKFVYDVAQISNWREINGGIYSNPYSGKTDFYATLREADLIDFVTC